jgi:anti-sigma28 factor (negative regulator of flagellin synthesis)
MTVQEDSVGANNSWDLPLDSTPPMSTPSPQHHRRKARVKTPVVEDEVRRNAKLRRDSDAIHIQLENEPRRRKGAARKTVRYSKVEELKSAIITRKIEHHDAEDWEIEDITAPLLVELGTGFCGVPPMELNISTLQDSSED